jgi:hypothetical protein
MVYPAYSRIAVLLSSVLLILLAGCQKKEIQGPKGDPGTPGGGGNASISSTNTFVVKSIEWKTDSLPGVLKVSTAFNELNKDVVEKGTIKVYILKGDSWAELPYDSGDLFMQYGFKEGLLLLYYINIEGGSIGPPVTSTFRMVIIT